MKIEITNLITLEKTLFINDYSLTENIVSHIILGNKQASQLLNKKVREEIKNYFEIIENTATVTGNLFAYCIEKNLHAKFVN